MKPAEFRAWLDRHNLNAGQAAAILDAGRATVDRYLDGQLEIPRRIELTCLALDPLRLYRLTPIDLDHIDWRASSRRDAVTVRAQNPGLARWHATAAFHVRTRRREGEDVSAENPWLQPKQARVDIDDDGQIPVGCDEAPTVPVGATASVTVPPNSGAAVKINYW